MRILLLIFVCITFFLSGIVFGNMQEGTEGTKDEHNEHVEVVKEVVVQVDGASSPSGSIDQELLPMTFTQKTASFLEGVVNGVYTVIVDILYEIASIFFSIV